MAPVNSSNSTIGWPAAGPAVSTAPPVMSTTAVRKPASPTRCTRARRGSGSPSDQASTSAFGGSISSISGYRVRSSASPAARRISVTRSISAAVNPSRGWPIASAGAIARAARAAESRLVVMEASIGDRPSSCGSLIPS